MFHFERKAIHTLHDPRNRHKHFSAAVGADDELGKCAAVQDELCFAARSPFKHETIGRGLGQSDKDLCLAPASAPGRHPPAARLAGLRAAYVNVLSEHALYELDLGGIGRLLAVTPNDEVNSLANLHFTDVFERSEQYQLAAGGTQNHNAAGIVTHSDEEGAGGISSSVPGGEFERAFAHRYRCRRLERLLAGRQLNSAGDDKVVGQPGFEAQIE